MPVRLRAVWAAMPGYAVIVTQYVNVTAEDVFHPAHAFLNESSFMPDSGRYFTDAHMCDGLIA